MSEEEKKELRELIKLLYNNHLSQYGKRKLEKYIEKQQKEIEELKNTETYKIAIIDKDNYISKDKIRFYYKKICASVNHFQCKTDNNIVLRIKKYFEELLEGETNK